MDDRGTRSLSFLYRRPKLNRTGFVFKYLTSFLVRTSNENYIQLSLRLETWIVGLEGLPLPNHDTTAYWCSIHESFPLDTPKYVIGVSHLDYL